MTIESIPQGLSAGTWTLDSAHSEVGFSVRHAGISKVRGKFGDVSAVATIAETLNDSSVTAVIKAESFFTGDPNRDSHVRGADFFDAEVYPELTFKSTEITSTGETFALTGDLTIHGETRQVTFDTEYNGSAIDPFGNTRAGFSAEASISRKDFGLTWNAALEAGGVLVGDKVTITLEIELLAAAPEGAEA